MKLKKGGWKYLGIGLLGGMASAIICLFVGAPVGMANAVSTGVSMAIVFSLKNKWLA